MSETETRRAQERLTDGDLLDERDPFDLFGRWLQDAAAAEPNDPTAMALATVDEDGLPDLRMVLLKGFDADGFVFYTNLESDKAAQIASNPRGALCFHWKSLRRQVRIRGPISPVTEAEADAYFATRPHGSRIGAWASRQSRALQSRAHLEEEVARFTAQYPVEVPRPAHWSGFRLVPVAIEFWRDRAFRLHDRARFTRTGADAPWSATRLYP